MSFCVCVCSSRSLCVLCHCKQPTEPSRHPIGLSIPASHLASEGMWAWLGGQPTDKTGCLSPNLIPNHSGDKASCLWHVHPSVAIERTSNRKLPPAHWDTGALTGTYCASRQAKARGDEAYISTLSQDNSSHIKSCWLIKRSAWQNDLWFLWYQAAELLGNTSNLKCQNLKTLIVFLNMQHSVGVTMF